MLKITGKLWFLVLFLSLLISVTLMSSSEAVTGTSSADSSLLGEGKKETYAIEEPTTSEPTTPEPTTPEPTTPEPTTLEPTTHINPKGDNSSGLSDKTEVNNLSKTDNKLPEQIPEQKPQPSDNGFFHVILIIVDIVLGLLIILCLVALLRMYDKLNNIEKRSKKNNSFESERSTKMGTTENELLERIIELERRQSKFESRFEQDFQKFQQSIMNIKLSGTNLTKEQPTDSLHQVSKKGASNPGDTFRRNSGIEKVSQESYKIQEIVVAFNEMMRETAKATGFSSNMQIRQKFMEDYRVIAFKCVNFMERVNHPEEKPRFVVCETSESTLWGVPLSGDTLAVLPSLREYESTAHSHGGLKELFKAGYTSGNYRNIEVIKPAIVTRDYKIIEKGELSLSR